METKSLIIRNRAKCLLCGSVIESIHRHDYVTCSCGNLSVDGGHDYIRRGFKIESQIQEMNEYKEISIEEYNKMVEEAKKRREARANEYYKTIAKIIAEDLMSNKKKI